MAGKGMVTLRMDGAEAASATMAATSREMDNIMRSAVYELAKDLAAEIKPRIPVKTGNLRSALKTRRGRTSGGRPYADVYFEGGTKAKNDGFYWRFVEYGTQAHAVGKGSNISGGKQGGRGMPAQPPRPFVGPAVEKFNQDLPKLLREKVGVVLEKRMARKAKRLAKIGAG